MLFCYIFIFARIESVLGGISISVLQNCYIAKCEEKKFDLLCLKSYILEYNQLGLLNEHDQFSYLNNAKCAKIFFVWRFNLS